ncbi:MAG: DNA replication/repair protein RecF [Ardenticatenaceae bacterium]|nr:DNA replication/repair protein RecF [Ardenticatenaceae bacterium]
MHIRHLSLTNFRNYGRLEIDLSPGATLLHGNNAQGKTNLMEAIYYLATTKSPHAEQDQQLINWDARQTDDPIVVGRLVAQVTSQEGERLLELRLIREIKGNQVSFRREALVNRRKVRLMDLLGNLRAVLFLPQDIELITGSPSQRRRYFDITLCQIDPIYCRTLSHYNKVLEQRNALLRQLAEGSGSRDLLSVYNERLVKSGSVIFARRAGFCDAMAREAQRIYYEELTDGAESIRLRYLPHLQENQLSRSERVSELSDLGEWLTRQHTNSSAIATRFMTALERVQESDIARGASSIGPHRDDWRIWINGRDLSHYGSRGQQRSAILALKMAEINWMANETGDTPILLLDEVAAELDEKRRALLLRYVQTVAQALLTATDLGMFTEEFLQQSSRLLVQNGRIQIEKQLSNLSS